MPVLSRLPFLPHSPHLPLIASAFVRGAILVIGLVAGGLAHAQETTLRVNVFPTSTNLGMYWAIEQSLFARRGLKIEVQNTPNSDLQRAGLAEGKFEIAHAAVDNAVAMVEGAKKDVIIILGGDGGLNEFLVRGEINSFNDIRGKVLAVDAPNTAYALVAKKILKNNGLLENRDYTLREVGGTLARSAAMAKDPGLVAGMVNPPFSFMVKEQGLKSMGRALDLIGAYQAGGAFVMRDWARANAGVLERYIAAYIEGTRAAMDPANRTAALAILMRRFKLSQPIAEQSYSALMTPGFGLYRDARFDMDGFAKVLSLRAEIEGQWGGVAPAPGKYLDLGYYDRALKVTGP